MKYWTFIQARCWRIYPLYGLVVLAAVLAMKSDIIGYVQQMLLLTPTAWPGTMFGQTWSIVIEFQFYLAFPILTLLMAREGKLSLLMIVAFLVILRFGLWVMGYDVNHLGYWSLIGRADQFLIGMVAASIYRNGQARLLANWFAFVASLVFLALVVQYFHNIYGHAFPWEQEPMTHWFSIIWPDAQAIAFALLVLSFLQLPARIPAFIEKPAFFVGTISFSIYIVHRIIELILAKELAWRALSFTSYAKLNVFLTCTLIELPIILAVATLAYYAIERPFHKFKRSYKIERSKTQPGKTLVPTS